MICIGSLRAVLTIEVKSDGFDSESAHFIVEAKCVSS
jgi:hypothetical protein